MPYPWKERVGMFLERVPGIRRFLFKYDGEGPKGSRYINRVSGHTVIVTKEW